jgi:hypothetical protein
VGFENEKYMNKTKHHYIPKFLLENFSQKGQIFIYRHDSKNIFCSSIKDAFTKSNLNTLTDKDEIKYNNEIEDFYERYFETKASASIRKIITALKNTPPFGDDIDAEDCVTLLRFCVLEHLRTPYSLEDTHHAMRVSAYAMIYLRYFIDFGTVHFPYDLDIEKWMLFDFLNEFDEATKLLTDLKITLYYHRCTDKCFIIPDQHVIIESPNNTKFGDKNLKMYMPISSHAILCFERVNRKYYKMMCELNSNNVEEFNKFILRNTYESFGCENKKYLESLVNNYSDIIIPLKRFNPYENFDKIKIQIKAEIIAKLGINFNKDDFSKSCITVINRNHEFKILNQQEFEEIELKNNNIYGLKLRQYEI